MKESYPVITREMDPSVPDLVRIVFREVRREPTSSRTGRRAAENMKPEELPPAALDAAAVKRREGGRRSDQKNHDL